MGQISTDNDKPKITPVPPAFVAPPEPTPAPATETTTEAPAAPAANP